jgi:DMSO/TMAO reductase YedYZ molybdopterin-dependent catalytic subunit
VKDLEIITEQPLNAEVRLSWLDGSHLPQDRLYMRSSFDMPEPSRISGEVEVVLPGKEPTKLTAGGLSDLDEVTLDMVLECAGNGRSLARPVPPGLAWHLGGVSPIRVTGVRLRDVLQDIPGEVVDLVFTGADQGEVRPEGVVNYQFSIGKELAGSATPILVTGIAAEPLGHEHGGPVRLVVPGHYAMKSVKWLTRIEGVTEPFTGHFVNRYRYLGDSEFEDGEPVGPIQVRSVISRPEDGSRVARVAPITIVGSAWSGQGAITLVEVSVDDGETWAKADLVRGESDLAATGWRHNLTLDRGRHTVLARASDATGATQPLDPRWNRLGYANNMVHRVSFEVG